MDGSIIVIQLYIILQFSRVIVIVIKSVVIIN